SSYPQESPRQVQLLYTEPCPFACGCAARMTLLQRSHSADSTTDGRSSSQLFQGAAGTPRVVALGMSSAVALVFRTRIRPQIVIRALAISAAIQAVVGKDDGTSTRFWGKPMPGKCP